MNAKEKVTEKDKQLVKEANDIKKAMSILNIDFDSTPEILCKEFQDNGFKSVAYYPEKQYDCANCDIFMIRIEKKSLPGVYIRLYSFEANTDIKKYSKKISSTEKNGIIDKYIRFLAIKDLILSIKSTPINFSEPSSCYDKGFYAGMAK